VIIAPLYQYPQYAGQVTDWLWQAFGPDQPRGFFADIVDHSQTPGALPLTFIALQGETLLGTAGLWRCDLISRQDLTPWLAALYIDEPARGKGLGGILQEHVVGAARQAGFDALYLYSACRDYYERFGWGYIGDGLEYPDKTVHLYHKAL